MDHYTDVDYCGDPNHPPCNPEVRIGLGIACKTFEDRKHASNLSYKVSDIGRKGVPHLSTAEIVMIRRIQRYINSPTLRFAFIGPLTTEDSFIVFDATFGPCYAGAEGYAVLNYRYANAFFEPGEGPAFVHAGSPMLQRTPHPWITPTPR